MHFITSTLSATAVVKAISLPDLKFKVSSQEQKGALQFLFSSNFSRPGEDTARTVISWWNTVRFAEAKSLHFVLRLNDYLSFSIDWPCWPLPTRVILADRYEDKGNKGWYYRPLKTVSSLVAIVYLGGDFLFELGELVLREGAGQDLRTPFDEVIHHVTDRVKHLTLVPLSTQKDEWTGVQLRHRRKLRVPKCMWTVYCCHQLEQDRWWMLVVIRGTWAKPKKVFFKMKIHPLQDWQL